MIPDLSEETYLPQTPEDFSEAKQRFEEASKKCAEDFERGNGSFASAVYPFHLWPESLVEKRRGGIPYDPSKHAAVRRSVARGKRHTHEYMPIDYREESALTPVKVRFYEPTLAASGVPPAYLQITTRPCTSLAHLPTSLKQVASDIQFRYRTN